MSPEQITSPIDILQPLRDPIATGDPNAILRTLPEPPNFLPALFRLDPADCDAIIAGVLPALTGDEDRWEIIEAAANGYSCAPRARGLRRDRAAHPRFADG